MSAPDKSIKLSAAAKTKMGKALDDLTAHIAAAADAWPKLTDQQRRDLLQHSPIVARFVALAQRFEGI